MPFEDKMIPGNVAQPARDRMLSQGRTGDVLNRESSGRSTGGAAKLRGDPAGLMGLLILGCDSGRSSDKFGKPSPSAFEG